MFLCGAGCSLNTSLYFMMCHTKSKLYILAWDFKHKS